MRDLERRKEKNEKEGLEEKIEVQEEAIAKWETVAQQHDTFAW